MKDFVYWYGVFTLAMVPLGIITAALIEKRTRKISKIIDELIPTKRQENNADEKSGQETDKKQKADKAPQQNPSKEKGKEEGEEKKNETEKEKENEKVLKLRTGDTYACRLNNLESKLAGREQSWTVTDSFIAEIDERTGLLNALHEGKTYVECGQIRMFLLEVHPKEANWILEQAYRSVLENRPMKEVSSTMAAIRGLMFDFNAMMRTKKYWKISSKDIKLCYRYAESNTPNEGHIEQAIAVLPVSEQQNMISGLSQRMKQIQVKKNSTTSYWVHSKWTEKYEDNITDMGAFIQVKKGIIIVGFSTLWKEGINEDEFKMNIHLFLRMFSGMLKNEDISGMLEKEDIIDTLDLPTPPAKASSKGQKPTSPAKASSKGQRPTTPEEAPSDEVNFSEYESEDNDSFCDPD